MLSIIFIKKYEKDIRSITRILRNNRRNFKEFYLIAKGNEVRKIGNNLLDNILKSLNRDAAYQELYQSFLEGQVEINKVSRIQSRRLRTALMSNIKDSMILQRNLMGAYVKKTLVKSIIFYRKNVGGYELHKIRSLIQKKENSLQ